VAAVALAKLTILVEAGPNVFVPATVALFNPNQVTITKNANWELVPTAGRDAAESQYTFGAPATLTVDLFFDTYETGLDVRVYTEPLARLATMDGSKHRPPLCRLLWGRGIFFQGVLESVTQTFTLFLDLGTPVRATLNCTFREWISKLEERKRLKMTSVDVAKTRTVRRGDTLSSIAGQEYRDPTLWRAIAEANGIVNPRVLPPGKELVIPALRPVRGAARR
jgi:nucleoid-associated protein YgaU